MRQIALQPRWADQMLCSQPSQCLTRMKVVTGVAHFFASGVVCSKYTRRTRWDCKFWTRPSRGEKRWRSLPCQGDLNPDPLYSWYHFSHPPLVYFSAEECLKETWKHVSNRASQTCIKFGIGISWSVWHISSHLAACWLDNLMVDLIESSGGASSCPEGLGSRCCKEGHITYITHSLARDPQLKWNSALVSEEKWKKTEHKYKPCGGTWLERREYWEAYWNWKCMQFLGQRSFHGAAWVEALHCADFWLRLYRLTAWQHYPLLPSSQLMFDQTWGIRKTS